MTATKIEIPDVTANVLIEGETDTVRLKDKNDDTQYLDMSVLSNGNPVFDMNGTVAGIMFLRSTATYSYLQLQGSAGQADNTDDGMTVGINGTNATIWNREVGTLTLASGNTLALTLDASQNATFVANLSTNGAATLGDAADDAHTVNGTLALASEHSTGPSAPAAGAGGIVYVKDDGKLYYISDDVAETDLTSGGGGGGLTITEVTSGATYSATTYDTMYLINVAGNIEVDLPTAASQAGKTIDIMAVQGASYQVTVDPNGSETINGNSASYVMSGVDYANLTLVSDGSNWVVR
jgi:hypothetical protein